MSAVVAKRYQALSRVWITSLSALSLKRLLPMKLIRRMPVTEPSFTSNTRSTRFCSSRMTLGSMVAAKRPLRR